MTNFHRALLALTAAGAFLVAAASAGAATTTFSSPGSYTFTVPVGVTSVSVTAIGGAGGSCGVATGGEGAQVAASLPVNPGEQLAVDVGQSGYGCGPFSTTPAATGGGGPGGLSGGYNAFYGGASGGGASLVAASPAPSFSMVVAGGGGGAGGYDSSTSTSVGGNGGNAGSAGGLGAPGTSGGGGATASGPGAGGATNDTVDAGSAGSNGTAWMGGSGGGEALGIGGGGGGGGYYGGGGGGADWNYFSGAGGGGGSSYFSPDATNQSASTPTSASPAVTITYAAPVAGLSTASLDFGTEPQGLVGPEQFVSVTNHGQAPLVISALILGGSNPGDFVLDNGCQQPVPVNASCKVGIRFSPEASGSRSATLSLLTNAATQSSPVGLTGTGGSLPTGPTGPQGATGSAGPPGAPGAPGKVELVTCKAVTKAVNTHGKKHTVTQQQCTTDTVTGTVKFTRSGAVSHAVVSRQGTVYATGVVLAARDGSSQLVLTAQRKLTRGEWTLTVRRQLGRHTVTTRRVIMVR